jgi:hypothetical protein
MKHKRGTRVLLASKNEGIKDQVFMRGTFDDNKEFYDNLHLMFGETLILQHYIQGNWHTRLSRSMGNKQEVNIRE